jgi:hypothetical protein
VAAGLAVGVLRRLTRLPARIPSLIEDLEQAHVDPKSVPGIVAVAAALAAITGEPHPLAVSPEELGFLR